MQAVLKSALGKLSKSFKGSKPGRPATQIHQSFTSKAAQLTDPLQEDGEAATVTKSGFNGNVKVLKLPFIPRVGVHEPRGCAACG